MSVLFLATVGIGAASVMFSRKIPLFVDGGRRDVVDDDFDKEVALAAVDLLVHNVGIPPVSTITWMTGDYGDAVPFLRDRMNGVLRANPWLAGRIVRGANGDGKPALRHPAKVAANRGEDFLVLISESESPLARSMKLPEMTRRSSPLTLRRNGPKEPLWRVCVVPCREAPRERFALIMSVSHTLGGASTYYSIHSMLTRTDANIRTMEIERVPDYHRLQTQLFGEEEVEYPSSVKMVHPLIRGTLHAWFAGAKIQQRVYLIDNEKMKALKVQGAAEDVPFVSTNDVLVSWFAQNSRSDYSFINVDAKGRLPSFPADAAGNYQVAIIYGKEDTASPALIRRSLTRSRNGGMIRRVVTPGTLPSYWRATFRHHFAMTSNWASTSRPVLLPTETCCREDLHSPLVDMSVFLPTTFTEMIIFRPYPGRTAIRITGHDIGWIDHSPPPFASEEEI